MKRFLVALIVTSSWPMIPASAGSNSCNGIVVFGKERTKIDTSDYYSPNPPDCWFKTDSPVGRKILKKCANGSVCWIELDLKAKTDPIAPSGKTIDYITP